jgi:Protein of unknown function (DUF3109)
VSFDVVWPRLSLPLLDDLKAPSPEPTIGVLRKHGLTHLPVLRVGESLVRARMLPACDSARCSSACCGTGVLADRDERERILAHADAVRRAMDPDQERDEKRWFDEERIVDHDFPSREAIGTSTTARGCIFLNREGRCVLQKATSLGYSEVVLKPFYCTAFPITIHQGVLSLDIDNVAGTRQCCQPAPGGDRSPVDVFHGELLHVLGEEGVEELRALVKG